MTGLGNRIREARELRGITQDELGAACGVSRNAVSLWESGGSAPTLDKIEPMTEKLDIDPVWLLRGKHNQSAKRTPEVGVVTVSVPEYDVRVSAGGGSFQISDETKKDVWLFSRRYVADELRLGAARLVVLEVIGDSMEPTLRPGDRVLVNMADRRVSQPGLFVLWDGDGTVVKRLELVPGTKPMMINRISDNPLNKSYAVLAGEVNIIGRVVWVARRM